MVHGRLLSKEKKLQDSLLLIKINLFGPKEINPIINHKCLIKLEKL